MTDRPRSPASAVLLLAIAGFATPHPAAAQAWPNKPIRWIVPFPPGGGTDIQSRIVAAELGKALGQQIVLDNRPGAGGSLGAEIAARATPDGYTIWIGQTSNLAINPTLLPKVGYDTQRDFQPVTLLTRGALILVVPPSSPVSNIKELIASAKASPGKWNFGSPGNGTVGHLGGEVFKLAAGVDMVHVPYKGAAQAITEVMGGQLALYLSSLPPAVPQVKAGKLKALGVTGSKRTAALPDVPAVAETLPGFSAETWYGLLTPAKVPREIVARLNRETVAILDRADIRARLSVDGGEVAPSGVEEFARFIREEFAKWSKVVKASGAKAG